MRTVVVHVADLRPGDLLSLPERPLDSALTVEVAEVRSRRLGERLNVWVCTSGGAGRAWHFGTYRPEDTIERVEN
jgi:hypothetical protein